MELQKQSFPIPFSQGINRKSDPWQIPFGQFYTLNNSIFTKFGRLTKRNGNALLTSLSGSSSLLGTFDGGLVSIGATLQAYADGTQTWVNKGTYRPLNLSVQSLVRSAANQTQCDAVTAPNGLVCVVWTETQNSVTAYKYAVFDSTSACVISPAAIVPTTGAVAGSPRVFLLGNHFMIVFTATISAADHLQYVAIATNTLSVGAAADITSDYGSAATVSWDGVIANNNLYLAWNIAANNKIKMTYIDSTLTLHSTVTVDSAHGATMMSVTADTTGGSPVIWATYYKLGTTAGYTLAVSPTLLSVLAATAIISSGTVLNITSSAQSAVNTVYYEVSNTYTYDSAIHSNYIQKNTITQAGTVGTAANLIRGVGLASKSFLISGTQYVLGVYSSATQPTNFLINSSGSVVGKLAYSNTGGYLTLGLPAVNVIGTAGFVAYLFKDQIEPVNKTQNAAFSTGVYTQTGVNAATFQFTATPTTAEIGGSLHISGAQLWQYDGTNLVEHGFHLWPDSVEATWLEAQLTPTGDSHTNTVLTNLSSTTGVAIGMLITGTDIVAGTTIVAFTVSTITLSVAATGSHNGSTFTIGTTGTIVAQPDGVTNTDAYFYQVLYQWTDAAGMLHQSAPSIPVAVTTTSSGSTGTIYLQVPTLRETLKGTAVKIVAFRWSVAQQTYYQVTSLTNPTLNSTSVDFVTITDTLADAAIVGNSIIYTNGGVIENIGAPATNLVALFDTRLFLVDAEDQNLLWFSKSVIEATPVETSDLFTKFISPTLGAQGNTGDISAIAPMDDKFIVFKPLAACYYFNGSGPDNLGNNNQYSEPIFITSTVGCTNPNIVLQPSGLMFSAGSKGIWLLGRDLSTSYIGAPVEDFNSQAVLSALTVPSTNQVRFTLSGGTTLMYDYYFQQWGTFTGINGVSATVFESLQTTLDAYGRVFQESPGVYLDGTAPVLMNFTTGWLNLAGLQGFQRAYYFYLLGQYISPHTLTVNIAYDYNPTPQQSTVITPDNFAGSWGSDPLYGDSDYFGGNSDVEQWRVFLKKQKCQALQISVQEAYDPSFGVAAGAGLTMSGINLIAGMKKPYPANRPALSVG